MSNLKAGVSQTRRVENVDRRIVSTYFATLDCDTGFQVFWWLLANSAISRRRQVSWYRVETMASPSIGNSVLKSIVLLFFNESSRVCVCVCVCTSLSGLVRSCWVQNVRVLYKAEGGGKKGRSTTTKQSDLHAVKSVRRSWVYFWSQCGSNAFILNWGDCS